MNYKEIVNNINKYHYFITSTSKTVLLSSSNDKSEAKKLALKKLEPNIDNFIGKKLILLRIKSVESAFEKQKEDKLLSITGGPIEINIEHGIIKSKNKIENKQASGNTLVYISKKYLKTHNEQIHPSDLKSIINDFVINKLNKGLFNQTIL
jgi:hypothetical protein